MSNQILLIATSNPGKMREYAGLFRDSHFQLLSLEDLGISHEVDETGLTFRENAWLKASEYAALAGIPTLADDSGLEVDVLGGEPGVKSARYGGEACHTDQDRVALLLRNLEGVPWEKRTARFRCVINIVGPGGSEGGELPPVLLASVVGSVAGMIQYSPKGDDGFGYDPVFYLPSCGKTIAQLSLDNKNQISHRADATAKALRKLAVVSPVPKADS